MGWQDNLLEAIYIMCRGTSFRDADTHLTKTAMTGGKFLVILSLAIVKYATTMTRHHLSSTTKPVGVCRQVASCQLSV